MNKLDYLAQKEEELRALNDQLDQQQTDMLANTDKVPLEDSYEDNFEQSINPDATVKGLVLEGIHQDAEETKVEASISKLGDSYTNLALVNDAAVVDDAADSDPNLALKFNELKEQSEE